MRKRIFSVIIVCLIMFSMSFSAMAHSGRTDANGGHWDRKTGTYHYHNSGSSSSSSSWSYSSAPKTVYATSITAKNVPSKINAGDSANLEASVYPSNAEDKTISWESSDSSVLTVSMTGKLIAVGVGTATITAKTSRGTSKTFTIIVNEVFAESISIADNEDEILLGDTKTLKCSLKPDNTTNKTVKWASSDEKIISVSETGKITANALGFATVTATHKQLTDSLSIEVKPVDAESIEIVLPDDIEMSDEQTPRIKKGETLQLETIIEPENTTYKDIEWSVNDKDIANVDKNGLLIAHDTGTVFVTATAKSGVTEAIEIEIYSNCGGVVAGIVVGFAVIGGGCAAMYRKKKKGKTGDDSLC